MEDATDFSWQGAKATHVVLLCEMECGVVKREESDRIDRTVGKMRSVNLESKSSDQRLSGQVLVEIIVKVSVVLPGLKPQM